MSLDPSTLFLLIAGVYVVWKLIHEGGAGTRDICDHSVACVVIHTLEPHTTAGYRLVL